MLSLRLQLRADVVVVASFVVCGAGVVAAVVW